jgi:hypothetical protein
VDWYPVDVDLKRLSQHLVTAQIRFRNDVGDDYVVDLSFNYGFRDVFVRSAAGESDPLPTGLFDLFEPIASGIGVLPTPNRTLIKREVVRI